MGLFPSGFPSFFHQRALETNIKLKQTGTKLHSLRFRYGLKKSQMHLGEAAETPAKCDFVQILIFNSKQRSSYLFEKLP